jgi:hypothetical protein
MADPERIKEVGEAIEEVGRCLMWLAVALVVSVPILIRLFT